MTSTELFGCNSLKGFNSFAVHPLYSIVSPILKRKAIDVITIELEKIGKVVETRCFLIQLDMGKRRHTFQ